MISYGYYHGYKGYRFCKNSSAQIPYTDFREIVAVVEYDNNLKAVLYSDLMFIETAIKNIVCNQSVERLKSGTFDYVYKERMNDNVADSELQSKRLRLRNSIYSRVSSRFRDENNMENQMIRHFYNRGEDAPLWVIFEILYLSDLASFFECLNKPVRASILKQMDMLDTSIDTDCSLLSNMLYTLKALRNSVAHNNIIFDTRFKDRKINRVLKKWLEHETGIQNITLYSLIDYIILVCCLLKRVDFSGTRARVLLDNYKEQNQLLENNVAPEIYSMIIPNNTSYKISGLEQYLS